MVMISDLQFDAPELEYRNVTLSSIEVPEPLDSEGKKKQKRRDLGTIFVEGQQMAASSRFWQSIYSRYGINRKMFSLFAPREVFERVREIKGNDPLTLCIEKNPSTDGNTSLRALGTHVDAKNVRFDQILGATTKPGSVVGYSDGIISVDVPLDSEADTTICGDLFSHNYRVLVPIDGYGNSSVAPSMLRQVCSNGMVAMGPVFQTTIPRGKTSDECFSRVQSNLNNYGHDEAFEAFRQRIRDAGTSYASVREVMDLYKLMAAAVGGGGFNDKEEDKARFTKFNDGFRTLTGDLLALYGVFSDKALSRRKSSILPSRCTVYELLNYSTEIRTHYVDENSRRKIDGAIGTMVSHEYDLQGSKEGNVEFADLYMSSATEAVGLSFSAN